MDLMRVYNSFNAKKDVVILRVNEDFKNDDLIVEFAGYNKNGDEVVYQMEKASLYDDLFNDFVEDVRDLNGIVENGDLLTDGELNDLRRIKKRLIKKIERS